MEGATDATDLASITDSRGDASGQGRGKQRLQMIVFITVATLAIGFSVGGWWNASGKARFAASPIPVGEYSDLVPRTVPVNDVGPDSRFVFESQGTYWYGRPTQETEYLIDGSVVTPAEYEHALSGHPPVSIDVVVGAPGQLSRIDVALPTP